MFGGNIARFVSCPELVSAVFADGQSAANNPLDTVEVFYHSIAGSSCQYHILVGYLSYVGSNFQRGSNLVDVIDIDALGGNIARFVSCPELVSAVFADSQSAALHPICTVEVFNHTIAGSSCQYHIFIGYSGYAGSNFQRGSILINIIYINSFLIHITGIVCNLEVDFFIGVNSNTIATHPVAVVKTVLNGFDSAGIVLSSN